MSTFIVNNQRIYARQEGPSNAQVAILIHGWSSSWYACSPLLPLLSRRFNCLAIDLPGYGNSPPMQKRVTIPAYADLIAELIQQVSPGPVVLIGHSMGGMIGVTLALRNPLLVERMVLLCPTISGNLSTYINLFISPVTMLERWPIANRILAALEPYMLNVTDRLMRPASFSERTNISEADYERLRADARRPGQGRVRAECYWAMRANNLCGKLDKIEPPSLVLWGAEDNTVPLRDSGVVADEWSSVDLRIIPKAGHWPQFETPDITRRYIAAFLGLPVITSRLEDSISPAVAVQQAAEFLSHSDVGSGLTLAQRTRLAGQCRISVFQPGEIIAKAQEPTSDLYIVQEGTIEIWSDPNPFGQGDGAPERLATLLPGQIAGELSMLDGAQRSAEMRAGSEGVTMLSLKRERLLSLCDDDPALGQRVLWNIATALALRLRLTNARLHIGQAAKVKRADSR